MRLRYPRYSRCPRKNRAIDPRAEARREREACYSLATAIWTKLPQKLRCSIYEYLIDDDYPDPVQLRARETGEDAYIKPSLRIFSPPYVPRGLAREAATVCYRLTHICCNTRELHDQLTNDIFDLNVYPYNCFSMLHLTISLEDMRGETSAFDLSGSTAANSYPAQNMAKEKADLTELYQTLEENFSRYLGVSPMSQTVHILLYMESYEYTQSPQRKSELKDMLDCERVFLNTLEAIRKPVYDLIHRGVKVVITWQEDSGDYDNDRGCECEEDGKTHETPMQNLFHLSKEEWEQVRSKITLYHPCPCLAEEPMLMRCRRRKPRTWVSMINGIP